jgi:putative SOS response-associated peptidase YedK
MCGRYSLTNPGRIGAAFPQYGFEEFSDYRLPRFSIAPTQSVLGVRNDGRNAIESLRWGLVPRWSATRANQSGQINARSETVATKPTFRDAFRKRRCIIFADGFYEWKNRRPTRFSMRDDEPFAFAGIWEAAGSAAATCAILTTTPNVLVATVHDRMPVILAAEAVDLWLSTEDPPPEVLASALRPFDADRMKAVPASPRLNSARYDVPDVLVDDEPPALTLGF